MDPIIQEAMALALRNPPMSLALDVYSLRGRERFFMQENYMLRNHIAHIEQEGAQLRAAQLAQIVAQEALRDTDHNLREANLDLGELQEQFVTRTFERNEARDLQDYAEGYQQELYDGLFASAAEFHQGYRNCSTSATAHSRRTNPPADSGIARRSTAGTKESRSKTRCRTRNDR